MAVNFLPLGKVPVAIAFATFALLGLTTSARAQEPAFPQRPVTIIVPTSPGTGHDILARTLGRKLSDRWGVGVVVDNKTGASGAIGAELASRTTPDGHTLLMAGTTFAIYVALNKNARYDPLRGFAPVTLAATNALVFTVSGAMPTKTLREFTTLAKSRPGEIHYASPGNGTPQHLSMELFKQNAGISITHVPYKNNAAALQELAGGHVSAMMLPVHTVTPLAGTGKVRVLAVLGNTRSRLFPDTPTLAEAGVQGVNAQVWFGLLAPAATPREIVRKINEDTNAMLKLPDVVDTLGKQGLTIVGGEPQVFSNLIKAEMDRWTRVIKDAKIQPD